MGDVRRVSANRAVGRRGEQLAAEELERQGLVLLARNWTCPVGEIDIVAEEVTGRRRTIVFCEVKCRSGLGFGDPLEAITHAKVRKLRQLAAEWLARDDTPRDRIRLDAIGVLLEPGRPPQLTHVRGLG